MKKIKWHPTQDHMIFESGHKTFDRQTNVIDTGNIIASTMLGHYIRAWNDTWHWKEGEKSLTGELFWFDIRTFKENFDIPAYIRKRVREELMDRGGILYCFFHWGYSRAYRRTVRVIHGYVLTTKDHEYIASWTVGPTRKSRLAIVEATKYVCHGEWDEEA